MSSTTPAASVNDIARHGWTAVPCDANVIFRKKPIVKPSALEVANMKFPADDPIVAKVQLYAKEHLAEQTYNHSMRVYYWGVSIIQDQFPEHRDELSMSTWALACLLHDIGTTHENLRVTLLSFEFHGAILALNLTKEYGASTAQAEAVAEAIIRHQDLGTVGNITFLGQVIQLATIYDNMGGNPALIDEITRLDVNRAFPRKGWSGCFAKTIREENGLKPWAHTTHLGEEDFPQGVENNSLMADVDDWGL
ncbi:putative cyanamide hydratase [Rosellinia necatrix]|uniref:Putative cyanamide hydratase n=1 Tax=Rosellinia necatrix TaxID=77044 RepID=A0A1W2TLV2_ROSNE|nr:putative cyanamide hydratase [Rosellinia necatrix]